MFQIPKNLIDSYIQRRKDDVVQLETALNENNIEKFNTIGHQMAGNAANFGFPELEELGRKMESLNLTQLKEVGPTMLDQLKTWTQKQN